MNIRSLRTLSQSLLSLAVLACQAPFPVEAPLAPGEAFAEVTFLFDS